ncbi:ubiquinone anaerobic biosynthesis accessory factor UbiT [Phaeovulum sp.]|uniref:ubiquinone anaerobic biosynthesis accessory factor UbiT n=1 Tax=Phaeovulum sp. TaxID=2934796 RepID=UPI0039E2A0D4
MPADSAQPLPRLPRVMAGMMRPLPLLPVSLMLSSLSRKLSRDHPGMFRRLGEHGEKRFVLDPTDLPLVLLMDLRGGVPKVTAHRRTPEADTRIAGPLSAFLGMIHGAYDGDALFFSRDLVVEGDTGAALALRNAIDDAELDLATEISALVGPLKAPLKAALGLAETRTGLVLHRVDALQGGW